MFATVLSRLFAERPRATQTELAQFVGVSPQAVQQWVSGTTRPTGERLEKVAQFFGVPIHELLVAMPRRLASETEARVKEALERAGWAVYAPRPGDASLPDLFRHEGYVPDLCAIKGDQTLYIELSSGRALNNRSMARLRRLQSLAQRTGNLIVVDYQTWQDAVQQAQAWLKAQEARAKFSQCVRVAPLDLEEGVLASNQGPPPLLSSLELDAQQALALFGRRDYSALRLMSAQADSMAPTIGPRDVLFVDTSITTVNADGIYALVIDGTLAVKRVQRVGERQLVVKSDNPVYEAVHIEGDAIDRLHIVGGVVCALTLSFSVFA